MSDAPQYTPNGGGSSGNPPPYQQPAPTYSPPPSAPAYQTPPSYQATFTTTTVTSAVVEPVTMQHEHDHLQPLIGKPVWGETPQRHVCQFCHKQIVTDVTYET